MVFKKIREPLISTSLVLISSLIGIRVINEFLKYNDRSSYTFYSSTRVMNDGSQLHVSHPKNFNIKTTGKDTVVFVSDSFGEGRKCGNSKNITGCLSKLYPKKKIVNLSHGGKSPAFYLKQIKTYINNQRDNDKKISGENVIISIYSNDIVLGQDSCSFFDSRKSKFKNLMSQKEFYRVNKKCNYLLSLSREEFLENKNFKIPFRNQIRNILGRYSFLFFREILAQLSLKLTNNISIGRAGYIPIWENNNSGEVILITEVLNEIVKICKVYNCNLLITTFPNVENLSPDSKVRLSLLSFSKLMENNLNIKIHDGYEPFISKKIKNASYSLTDTHSNCDGYELYANWLVNLK